MAPLLLALMVSVGSSHPQQNALWINIARVEAAETKLTNPEFAITLENRGAKELAIAPGWKIGMSTYPNLARGSYAIQARLQEAPLKIGKPDVQWPPANLWTDAVLSNVVTFTIP